MNGNKMQTRMHGRSGLRGRQSRRGFTLMEILISIAVIVVGLVGVVSVFPVALRDVQVNQDISISAQIAQSVKSALRAGFANAKWTGSEYVVTFVHPGRRPGHLPPVTVPSGLGSVSATDEVLDYLILPGPGTEAEDPYIYPGYPQLSPLDFYTVSYPETTEEETSVRYYGQTSIDTTGTDRENGFETLRDPYHQYGFNVWIKPMENADNLFMVGIFVSRNPELYVQIGGSDDDDLDVIKDEFFTIMSVR